MIDYKVENGTITSIDGYEVGGGTAVEANPQEEATQQLEKIKIDNIAYNIAGGGGNNKLVTSVTTDSTNKGQIRPQIHWSSSPGLALLPNTSYQVGDQVKISYDWSSNKITIGENQIFVPVSCAQYIEDQNKKLTYGDVILVLTNTYARFNCTADKGNVYPFVENYATYTVVKAGTTGDNVSVPTSGWVDIITYMIYTLEVKSLTE